MGVLNPAAVRRGQRWSREGRVRKKSGSKDSLSHWARHQCRRSHRAALGRRGINQMQSDRDCRGAGSATALAGLTSPLTALVDKKRSPSAALEAFRVTAAHMVEFGRECKAFPARSEDAYCDSRPQGVTARASLRRQGSALTRHANDPPSQGDTVAADPGRDLRSPRTSRSRGPPNSPLARADTGKTVDQLDACGRTSAACSPAPARCGCGPARRWRPAASRR